MRPHLFSKVLSLYDRVVHHGAPEAVPVAIDPEQTLTSPIASTDDDDDRITAPMAARGDDTRDEGDLYGVHTPIASDRRIPDDDRAFEGGQNWIEALEESAAEGGPLPEHELDVVDEDDNEHPHTETKDRPIADLGSGGRGGM
jgi:hypothetical protein